MSVAAPAAAVDRGLGSLRDRVTAASPTNAPARPLRDWRGAVRDRLPVWLQVRCGIEPKTLAALAVVLLAAVGLAVHHFWSGRPHEVHAPQRVPQREDAPAAGAAPPDRPAPPRPVAGTSAGPPSPPVRGGPGARDVVVDVAGKVRQPGVRRLPAGSRVEDALEAAGGVRPGTDTSGLNRARVLVDGELILVGAGPGVVPPPGGPAAGTAPGAVAGPVSLNSATAEQLEALPGVGPVLARHIVDYRDQHGGFRSVADLQHVTGIGARRFADLKPLVQP
ncbi:ComEA family DNA-binding protein [Streptomyces sp. NPDC049555]|uniref:ComEA family DNA-binding protein n=1 Tax=Streptomyces sp. NPDC049555 TaxID=3154930 RepID=UPI0034488C01